MNQARIRVDATPSTEYIQTSSPYAHRYRATSKKWFAENAVFSGLLGKPPYQLSVQFTFPDHNHRDLDNFVAALKPWQDVIADHYHFKDHEIVQALYIKRVKKGENRVEFLLTPFSETDLSAIFPQEE